MFTSCCDSCQAWLQACPQLGPAGVPLRHPGSWCRIGTTTLRLLDRRAVCAARQRAALRRALPGLPELTAAVPETSCRH